MSDLILIIEDEPDLVSMLEYNLKAAGYDVASALTGSGGLSKARATPRPDLLLLDRMLPDISGTSVCRQLRGDDSTRGIPVIMVTARGEEQDRISGLEVGADDYVVKPYSVRELLLRIQAVLRRTGVAETPEEDGVEVGGIRVDPSAHRVWSGGVEVELTALEFRLLHTFLLRRDRVQTRDQLLEDVWGYEPDLNTRTVDTHVKRLREKLGAAGQIIETVRGVGYRLSSSAGED